MYTTRFLLLVKMIWLLMIVWLSQTANSRIFSRKNLALFRNYIQKRLCSCIASIFSFPVNMNWLLIIGGCHGRGRMVGGFTTTYVISPYHHWCCELESRSERDVQHYVIKFVSDWWQVGGFLRVLRFPPPIKLTATI